MKIINNEISTPDQSGPGLTATSSGAVSKKGPSGNCWPRIKEQEETCQPERRKGMSMAMRVETLNVNTVPRKGG